MTRPFPSTHPKGFSLIEMMVAIVIGMVTVLVATHVLTNSLQQKRASASGSDTNVNATLALYSLERDIKNAGFGMNQVINSMGCQVRRQNGAQATQNFPLVPVWIGNGVAGGPDRIRILASDNSNAVLPLFITRRPADVVEVFEVEYAFGVMPGDMMIAVPTTEFEGGARVAWCSVFQATAVQDDPARISRGNSPWNQAADLFPNGADQREYWIGDYLINLGSRGVDRIYDINVATNALRLTQFDYANPAAPNDDNDLYPHILQLQAVYGKDTGTDGTVDVWEVAQPANAAAWRQVIAIRLAIVARGTTREMQGVTPANDTCANLAGGAAPPATAVCWRPDPAGNWEDIDVSAVSDDWQRYRYRVLETTIPLRNTIWAR